MAPSLRLGDTASFLTRPLTRDREHKEHKERPTSNHGAGSHSLMVPSRTSSLHSRITQPIPSQLTTKSNQRTPKTLTHAYMVCGVGREPSQWVKAPAPAQGKIGHMKGAVGQFWLPEILGSSPRLEQDNEIARALYSAMRVGSGTGARGGWESTKELTFLTGMLPSRCRDMHRPKPATLRSPLVRAPARLLSHPLRHCASSLVESRREESGDDS